MRQLAALDLLGTVRAVSPADPALLGTTHPARAIALFTETNAAIGNFGEARNDADGHAVLDVAAFDVLPEVRRPTYVLAAELDLQTALFAPLEGGIEDLYLIGFSEVLGQHFFGELNEKQDEYVADILAAGQHQLALINDILDLSKVEAGRMELQVSAFSLVAAVEVGLTMIRERASLKEIAIVSDVDPSVDRITADERKIKQVLFNLLSNAVKFTPIGDAITLTARPSAAGVVISVQDTGVGIAPEDPARVFEEIQQTRSGQREEASTGLGLTLARKFVELHGGRIWLESEVGKGSTFLFTLPLAPPATPVSE